MIYFSETFQNVDLQDKWKKTLMYRKRAMQGCIAVANNVTAMEKYAWYQNMEKEIVPLATFLSMAELFVLGNTVNSLWSLEKSSAKNLALLML